MRIDRDAPCKGCKERTIEPNCHMICERYLEFIERRNVRKAEEEKHHKEYRYSNYNKSNKFNL